MNKLMVKLMVNGEIPYICGNEIVLSYFMLSYYRNGFSNLKRVPRLGLFYCIKNYYFDRSYIKEVLAILQYYEHDYDMPFLSLQ